MTTQTTTRLGGQNRHVQTALLLAELAVDRLMERGFTVLSVSIESARPLIEIQPCAACETLAAVWCRRINHAGRIRTTMTADFDGCEVRWQVTGQPS